MLDFIIFTLQADVSLLESLQSVVLRITSNNSDSDLVHCLNELSYPRLDKLKADMNSSRELLIALGWIIAYSQYYRWEQSFRFAIAIIFDFYNFKTGNNAFTVIIQEVISFSPTLSLEILKVFVLK